MAYSGNFDCDFLSISMIGELGLWQGIQFQPQFEFLSKGLF
jgi:hypothetical protein